MNTTRAPRAGFVVNVQLTAVAEGRIASVTTHDIGGRGLKS
jgi:hypothetical protein